MKNTNLENLMGYVPSTNPSNTKTEKEQVLYTLINPYFMLKPIDAGIMDDLEKDTSSYNKYAREEQEETNKEIRENLRRIEEAETDLLFDHMKANIEKLRHIR